MNTPLTNCPFVPGLAGFKFVPPVPPAAIVVEPTTTEPPLPPGLLFVPTPPFKVNRTVDVVLSSISDGDTVVDDAAFVPATVILKVSPGVTEIG